MLCIRVGKGYFDDLTKGIDKPFTFFMFIKPVSNKLTLSMLPTLKYAICKTPNISNPMIFPGSIDINRPA